MHDEFQLDLVAITEVWALRDNDGHESVAFTYALSSYATPAHGSSIYGAFVTNVALKTGSLATHALLLWST